MAFKVFVLGLLVAFAVASAMGRTLEARQVADEEKKKIALYFVCEHNCRLSLGVESAELKGTMDEVVEHINGHPNNTVLEVSNLAGFTFNDQPVPLTHFEYWNTGVQVNNSAFHNISNKEVLVRFTTAMMEWMPWNPNPTTFFDWMTAYKGGDAVVILVSENDIVAKKSLAGGSIVGVAGMNQMCLTGAWIAVIVQSGVTAETIGELIVHELLHLMGVYHTDAIVRDTYEQDLAATEAALSAGGNSDDRIAYLTQFKTLIEDVIAKCPDEEIPAGLEIPAITNSIPVDSEIPPCALAYLEYWHHKNPATSNCLDDPTVKRENVDLESDNVRREDVPQTSTEAPPQPFEMPGDAPEIPETTTAEMMT